MRRALISAAVGGIAAGIFLTACAQDIDHGVVGGGKHIDHTDGYTTMQPITSCSGYPTSTCTTSYYPQYIPPSDTYWLHLKNKTKAAWRSVSEDEYNRYNEGDYYGIPDK